MRNATTEMSDAEVFVYHWEFRSIITDPACKSEMSKMPLYFSIVMIGLGGFLCIQISNLYRTFGIDY